MHGGGFVLYILPERCHICPFLLIRRGVLHFHFLCSIMCFGGQFLIHRNQQEAVMSQDQTQKTAEDQTQKTAEDQTQKTAEDQTQKTAEDQTQKTAEDQTQKTAEDQTQKTAEDQTQKTAEDQTQKTAEDQTQKTAEDQTQKTAEDQTQKTAEDQTQKTADQQVSLYQNVMKQMKVFLRWLFTGNHLILTVIAFVLVVIAVVLMYHVRYQVGLNQQDRSPTVKNESHQLTSPPPSAAAPPAVREAATPTYNASSAMTSPDLIIGNVCKGIKSDIDRMVVENKMSVDDFYGYVWRPTPVQGKPDQLIKAFAKVVWCDYNAQLHKAILSYIGHLRQNNVTAEITKVYKVGPTSQNMQTLQSCAKNLDPYADRPTDLTAICTGVLYGAKYGVHQLQLWLADRIALVKNGANRLFLTIADVIALVGDRVNKNIGKYPAALLGASTES